ncbi:MAG: glycoside hydrolase family 172 protein [Phycisphaerales bacterium JB038]
MTRTPRLALLLTVVASSLLLGCAPSPATHEPIGFASLLKEMVDRGSLARWPEAAYTCRQASSYDRDSDDPANPETWFANWDRSQFVRSEARADGGVEQVLLDEAGPGAIVRFWGTWHGPRGGEFSNGTLRVYLDESSEPVIEGPIRDLISGGALVGPPLSDFVSKLCPAGNRAHNLYLPIPYARHCKITYETDVLMDRGAREGEALYYQINFRTYEPGTAVRTFEMADLERHGAMLERVQALLTEPGVGRGGEEVEAAALAGLLPAGESREVKIEGPAAIDLARFRLSADDLAQALRSTVLEIVFDGEGSVWCPVGDFFGAAYEPVPFETWYTTLAEDGTMTARWVMPFARSAMVRLHNLGEAAVQVEVAELRTSPWTWDARSMHFHASWREYADYDTRRADMSGRGGPRDANYISIAGRGVYVGDTLTLFDCAPAWWGEGDEKIYIDGESFPSHFGTGTEDYYGYAWCRGEYFTMPFHAQPLGTGNLGAGPTVNVRYRALDAIPFRSRLRFDMEIWSWADTKLNYAPTTYWYARPGARSNVEPQPEAARAAVVREVEELVPIFRVEGAVEGESLQIARRTGGTTEVQDIPHFGWSGNQQLWWRDASVGDEIDLVFEVEEDGVYVVTANLTMAVDYGVVGLAIDGVAIEGEHDRYATQVQHDLVDLGRHRLGAGEHTLTVRVLGANEQAIKRHMFGLDYLLVRRQP